MLVVVAMHLLLLLLTTLLTLILLLRRLGLLPPDTAWTPATERRSEREVDVLLRIETDDERWHVDDLAADTVVTVKDCISSHFCGQPWAYRM